MNSPNDNILKPKNSLDDITSDKNMSSGKKRRSEDDTTKCTKNKRTIKKKWLMGVTEKSSDDVGISMLDPEEFLERSNDSSNSNNENNPELDFCSNSSPCDYVNSEDVNDLENVEPCCSTKTDDSNVIGSSEMIEDFYICRKRPFFTNENPDLLSKLSDEVILHIFKWLPKSSLIRLSLVSKRFYRLSRDESLWTRLDLSCRSLFKGALGEVLSRQVVILRMSQTTIEDPSILPTCDAFHEDFHCKLQYLDLSMTSVSFDTLVDVFERCHLLKKISLENVPVNDIVCRYISQNLDLEVLNLSMVRGLNMKCLNYLLKSLRKLKELNLAWTHLNSDVLNFICNNLPSTLQRLNISGCRKTLKDDNIEMLVGRCPNLKELDISDCTTLTSKTIDFILTLKNLNFLAMSRCYSIPPSAFKRLTISPCLSYIDIHGQMSETAIGLLKECFQDQVTINKFMFSSVARPTVGVRRTSIWNLRVRD